MNTIFKKLLLVVLACGTAGPFMSAMIQEAILSNNMSHKELIEGIKELPHELKLYIVYLLFENSISDFQLYETVAMPSNSGVFSHTGELYLTGLWDKSTVSLRNSKTGSLVKTFYPDDTTMVTSLVFSHDGEICLIGRLDGAVYVWNSMTGNKLCFIQVHTKFVSATAFSPEGETALTGSGDGTLCLWDYETGKWLHTFHGHTDSVTSLAYSPEGEAFLSGSWDATACIWDAKTGELVTKLRGHSLPIKAVIVSPDGKKCLTGSLDQTARMWDFKTGKLLMVFSKGENTFSTRLCDKAVSWALSYAEGLLTYQRAGYMNSVFSVAFSPDGLHCLTGLLSGEVCVWDSNNGELIATIKGASDAITSLAFSVDGEACFSGSKGIVGLWKCAYGLSHITEENKEIIFKRFLSLYPLLQNIIHDTLGDGHNSDDAQGDTPLLLKGIGNGLDIHSGAQQHCILS